MTIYAGQRITAATLNQYYGNADGTATIVTAQTLTPLSSVYVIPAGEPQAGSAYELYCAGHGTQGTSTSQIQFAMSTNGTTFGTAPSLAAGNFTASQAFSYALTYKLVCVDGINSWWCSLQGACVQSSNALNDNIASAGNAGLGISDANTGTRTAAVSASISVAVYGRFSSNSASPTMTNIMTTFRKIA